MRRFRSIISRVVALHVIAIGVTSILMPLALYWLLNQAANSLHRDALRSQAATIAGFLRPQPDGSVTLDIPSEIQPLYSGGYGLYAYAVLDASGRVLFSSRNDGTALFSLEESGTGDWIERLRSTGSVLFGVSVARPVGQRMYWIQVGQDLSHRDVIIDDVVTTFFPRVGWITFPILLVLLLIDILIFRRALAPVREASTTAAAIGPARTDVRLPEQAMPAEIVPLVHAVNQAFDRLEAGFRAQRDFTADMAHELRTPLAIMRARVDSLELRAGARRAAQRPRQHDAHREPGARHRRAREFRRRRRRQGRSPRRLRRGGRLHGAACRRDVQDDRAHRRRRAGLGVGPSRGAVPGRAQSRRQCHPAHQGWRLDRGRRLSRRRRARPR